MKKWQKLKGILGIIIMLFFLACVFFWETFGRETFIYKDVVVPIKSIEKDTVITRQMLKIEKVEASKLIDNPVIDVESIVGLAAKQYIPGNAQLIKSYFDEPGVVLSEGEFIFKVPNEWIMAFPSSIRRYDEVYFYAVDTNINPNITSATPVPQLTPATNNVQASSDPMHVLSDNSTVEPSPTPNVMNELKGQQQYSSEYGTGLDIPVLKTTVAFVKDNANREVVTVGNKDRYDGSSKVNDIEIIVKVDKEVNDIKALEEQIRNGKKFIVLYRD
jgi:hypothetical protein